MFEVRAVPRTLMLWLLPVLMVIAAACGGGSETPIPQEPMSATLIVTDVQVTSDDKSVESISSGQRPRVHLVNWE